MVIIDNRKIERKEKIINIIKPLLLTFLPIIFKYFYDLWKENKNISENIIPLILFVLFAILDIAVIIYFGHYDFLIRDKEHKSQIESYEKELKDKNDIIKDNASLLNTYENKINIYKNQVDEKEKEVEEQKETVAKLRLENEKKQHSLMLNSNSSKAIAFSLIDEIVSGTADTLYQEIKRIRNNGHSEIVDWGIVETYCDKICQTLFDYITKISKNGRTFSVSIIFKMNKSSKEGYFMPSRVSSDKHKPKIYRNFEPKDKYENYCFNALFENNSTKHKIYMNNESLKQDFENYNPSHSQYIGIPICCTGGKKIALIQVVAYKDSLISDSKESLESLTTELFIPIANSVFLINKIENTLQVLNGINSNPLEQKTKKGIKAFFSGGHGAKR